MLIRKMVPEDLDELYRLLSDPAVMRFLEPEFTRESTEKFLSEAGMSDPPAVYAAEHDGRFIGYVIYHGYDEKSMEIGWVLLPEYWGKGLASGLTELLISEASASGKDAVIECVPEQEATKRIALRYGFTYEGREDGLDIYRLRCS